MSDLLLVLHERIEVVRRGVRIGTDRLQEAQDSKGLSNEAIARALHISEKTWRRWKKLGEVPRYHLEAAARLLGMTIEIPNEGGGEVVASAEERLDRIELHQEELKVAVDGMSRILERLVSELEERLPATSRPSLRDP